jgi:hypothetical protein
MMMANYGTYPSRLAVPLAHFFAHVTSRSANASVPALVHCSFGKDRTGFMIAILLSALGVSREIIYQDYMATEQRVDREYRILITEQAIGALHDVLPDRAALGSLPASSPHSWMRLSPPSPHTTAAWRNICAPRARSTLRHAVH